MRPSKTHFRLRISLIRVFDVRSMDSQGCRLFFRQKTQTLITLCGCADWFESSLYKHRNLYLMRNTGSFAPRREKACLQGFANNKDADRPAHPRRLISVLVMCLMETCYTINFTIVASLCS